MYVASCCEITSNALELDVEMFELACIKIDRESVQSLRWSARAFQTDRSACHNPSPSPSVMRRVHIRLCPVFFDALHPSVTGQFADKRCLPAYGVHECNYRNVPASTDVELTYVCLWCVYSPLNSPFTQPPHRRLRKWGLQQLCKSCRTCFKFYDMFYFTCDRSFRQSTKIYDETKQASLISYRNGQQATKWKWPAVSRLSYLGCDPISSPYLCLWTVNVSRQML